jgi:hypothetical protein
VAFKKYINIPFSHIASADLRHHASGTGDIALATDDSVAVPYFHLWPFARPMRFTRTVPLLRALPDPDEAGRRLASAMAHAAPESVKVTSRPQANRRPQTIATPALDAEVSLS